MSERSVVIRHSSFVIRIRIGVRVRGDAVYRARAVVLTTGTFLQALMHTGETKTPGGRAGEGTTGGISGALDAAWLSAWRGSRRARRRG